MLAPKCLVCREPSVGARICVRCVGRGKAGARVAAKFAARVAAGALGSFLEREHPVAFDTLRAAHTSMRRAQFENENPELDVIDARVVDKGGRRA